MASTYQLQPDEWVVSKTPTGTAYHGSRPTLTTNQTELVLTSRNIIVVSQSPFGRPKGARYFPLDQVKVVGARPQVFSAGGFGSNRLEVHFLNGQESFGFGSRSEVLEWADNISRLITGRADEITTTTDLSSPVGDPWKETVEQVKASFGLAGRHDRQRGTDSNTTRSARKCTSCSAPIAGTLGSVVRCEYCQSHQQL